MQIEPNDLWLFAKIAELGSFSKAGVAVGMPKSTLSRRLSQFEQQLGERLFQRTTRQLTLTEFGVKLLAHGRQVGEELDAAIALTQHRQLEPNGVLRVSMPNDLANLILLPVIADFIAHYPAIALELDLTARRVDLLSEQFDLAIRMGDLPDDATLAAKPIGRYASALYASPEYLDRHGIPVHPDDLCQHDTLQLLTRTREANLWQLLKGEELWSGIPKASTRANSPELLINLALRHLGITAAPTIYAESYVETGQLRRILPDWQLPEVTAWAVFPGRRLMPAKTRALLDFLETDAKKLSRK